MVKREPLDPEVLAALLEGKLPAGERDEVLERLAQSPDDYEAFVEAASVLRDLEDDAGAAPVPPPPSTPSPPVPDIRPARRRLPPASPKLWLPLAAVLAGVLVVSRLGMPSGEAAPVALLERDPLVPSGSLEAALGPDWDRPGWSVRRGGGQSLAGRRRDFRIGVRLAELDAALDAGDARAVRRVAPQLVLVMEQAGADAGLLAEEYEGIAALATAAEPRRDPGREAAAAVRLVDLLDDSPWFGLGVWVEQARLATLAGRTEFFGARDVQGVLDELIDSLAQESGEGASVAGRLRELRDRMRGGVAEGELQAVRAQLAAVVRESGG